LLLYIGDRPDADDLLKKIQALPLMERQQLLDRIEACPSNILTQALLDCESGSDEFPSLIAEQIKTE
jgi:hypothetical protein